MRPRSGDAQAHTRPPRKTPANPAHLGRRDGTLRNRALTLVRQVYLWRDEIRSHLPGKTRMGGYAYVLPNIILAVVLLFTSFYGCSALNQSQPTAGSTPTVKGTPPSVNAGVAGEPAKPAGKPSFLSTAGSKIVDSEGQEVRLTGVNWFGMETGTFAPHGLWARNWEDMLDQIRDLGYNAIRLPFSNRMLDPNAKPLEGIDFKLNPDLRGLTGLQIMDKIVEGAGKRGLKIMLDRHRPDTESQAKLWYTETVSEEQWIADWKFLAERYRGNDTVVAADIHNEPAGDATWGTGDPKTDWRLAAERCGNAIHEVNQDWLIVVEGIEKFEKDWYWMGGSLQGVAQNPVRLIQPNKLVYSAHDYGPGVHNQGWFSEKDFPRNMPAIWDTHWGYIVKQNIAPVILGEFGGRSVSSRDKEGIWQQSLVDYLKQNGISYTYWSLNPNSGDTGGVLDDDWKTVHKDKQQMLSHDQAPKMVVNAPAQINTGIVPMARKNPLPSVPLKVLAKGGNPEEKEGEAVLDLQVANSTPFRAPLQELELRYWLNADLPESGEGALAAYAMSLDWSAVKGVKLELVPDSRRGQTHYLKITFGEESGMMPREGKLELKVRLKNLDRQTIVQANDYSYQKGESHSANERIGMYLWGEKIWGNEP